MIVLSFKNAHILGGREYVPFVLEMPCEPVLICFLTSAVSVLHFLKVALSVLFNSHDHLIEHALQQCADVLAGIKRLTNRHERLAVKVLLQTPANLLGKRRLPETAEPYYGEHLETPVGLVVTRQLLRQTLHLVLDAD